MLLVGTTQRGDKGVKAEKIGGEREGDFSDNFNAAYKKLH
jgi:hypothetical protein